MPCEVKFCTCKSDFQDRKYGANMRVHNVGPKTKTEEPTKTCTVCIRGMSIAHQQRHKHGTFIKALRYR